MIPSKKMLIALACGSPLWVLGAVHPAALTLVWLYLGGWLLFYVAGVLLSPRRGDLVWARVIPTRLSKGQSTAFSLELEVAGNKPMWVDWKEFLPVCFDERRKIFSEQLLPGRTVTLEYDLTPVRRGTYVYPPARVRLCGVLGLTYSSFKLNSPALQKVRVYPRFHGVGNYELLAKIDERKEALRIPRLRRGAGRSFESMRHYVPGDDLKSVDWKVTARRGRLIARNFQVERGQQVSVLVDCGRYMMEPLAGTARLEHAFEAAVALAYVAKMRGDDISVGCFSNKIEAWCPPVSGAAVMPKVLETLRDVTAKPIESDYWLVVARVLALLRKRNLIVVFTDVIDSVGSRGLLNNLARARRKHLVLCVLLSDPGAQPSHRPPPDNAAAAFDYAAAGYLYLERQLVIQEMKDNGILVLETTPGHIGSALISRYLQIRGADLQ